MAYNGEETEAVTEQCSYPQHFVPKILCNACANASQIDRDTTYKRISKFDPYFSQSIAWVLQYIQYFQNQDIINLRQAS